jgi:short-subunit dehydrogenase
MEQEMADDFADRFGPWALVTGASSGIGEQFARQLAARGLHLVITARRTALLENLAADIKRQYGTQVEVLALDLTRPDFIEPLLNVCDGKNIGLVVSNAGFGLKGEHHQLDATRLSAMLSVNCHAPMLLAHAFAPNLLARGRGGLLLTGSIEGFIAFPLSTAYAATKAFVMALGEGLWGELKARGVDVMVLAPGATDTDAPILQGIDRSQLVGLMSPSEVARQALAQLGKKPVFITGWMNRLMVGFLTALPRRVAVRVAGGAMKTALERSRKMASRSPR